MGKLGFYTSMNWNINPESYTHSNSSWEKPSVATEARTCSSDYLRPSSSTWAKKDLYIALQKYSTFTWSLDDVMTRAVLTCDLQMDWDLVNGEDPNERFKSFSYSESTRWIQLYIFVHIFFKISFISFAILLCLNQLINIYFKQHEYVEYQEVYWLRIVMLLIPCGSLISMLGAGPLRATVTSLRLGSKGICQVLLTPLKWSVDSRWTLDDCTASSTHFRTYSEGRKMWRMQESRIIYIVGNVPLYLVA